MAKVSQIEAYDSIFNYDFICISEAYFVSSVLEGDRGFQLSVYSLVRADHQSNAKRGGVCIYYKEFLRVREVKLSNLSQSVICEVSLRNYKGYIGVAYRSPGQDNEKFKIFYQILMSFEQNVFIILLVYSNSK